MAVDFSKFDEAVDTAELQKEVEAAQEMAETPDGNYIVSIDKMEIKTTKAGDKLMFAVQMKIKEGDQKGRMIFFNRTITGSKSEKWTDGMAIKSVCTWVNELLAEDEAPVEFINYTDFADQILDVFQAVKDAIEVDVTYENKNFNPIKINEVIDL
jgi:hypothetical protein